MAYSDFTLADLRKRFGLTVAEGGDLFASVPEAELSAIDAEVSAFVSGLEPARRPALQPRRVVQTLFEVSAAGDAAVARIRSLQEQTELHRAEVLRLVDDEMVRADPWFDPSHLRVIWNTRT